MKRFDTDIGSVDTALQQRPEVFHAVGVNLAVNVSNRVVDHLMRVVTLKTAIGKQRIAVQRGTRFNVLSNLRLKRITLAARNDLSLYLATTLDHSKNDCFVFAASTG